MHSSIGMLTLYLPHHTHLGDVGRKGLDLLLSIASFHKVVGARVTEREEPVREDFADGGVEVVHVFLIGLILPAPGDISEWCSENGALNDGLGAPLPHILA